MALLALILQRELRVAGKTSHKLDYSWVLLCATSALLSCNYKIMGQVMQIIFDIISMSQVTLGACIGFSALIYHKLKA